jgi:signal transduction histidine kinase
MAVGDSKSVKRRQVAISEPPKSGVNRSSEFFSESQTRVSSKSSWHIACTISWVVFVAYQIGIGCDRLYSGESLCPYSEEHFGAWYRETCVSCLCGLLLVWCLLLLKIFQMEPDDKRIPLWVSFNVTSMASISTFLSVVFNWGGVCVDSLNVASPAAIWGEWMASGPLLIYITLNICNTSELTKTDMALMGSFFLCLLAGFLIIIPQSPGLAKMWLTFSCLFYLPLLVLPWYKGKHEVVVSDEKSIAEEHHTRTYFAESPEMRRNLSIWLTIVLPLYTIVYLVALWGGIDYALTIALYQVLNMITKGLFSAVIMDIHLHLLAKTEMLVAQERRANEARREHMKYIFHEVRTPLNSITMGIDLLEDGLLLGCKEKEYLDMMRSATVFMSDTLNDVLSLQKIEEGKLELEISSFNIRKSVDKVFNTMKGTAARKKVTLKNSFSPNTPYHIHADMHRIEHVISNLVSNAIKFSPEKATVTVAVNFEELPADFAITNYGSLRKNRFSIKSIISSTAAAVPSFVPKSRSNLGSGRIESVVKKSNSGSVRNENARRPSARAEGRHRSQRPSVVKPETEEPQKFMNMTVSIIDQGPGISPEDQAKLFNNFVQVRAGTLQQGQGSGLGLSFVKKIVQLHGGDVAIVSKEGQGSTFRFNIPVAVQQKEDLVRSVMHMRKSFNALLHQQQASSEQPSGKDSNDNDHARAQDGENVHDNNYDNSVVSEAIRRASAVADQTINSKNFPSNQSSRSKFPGQDTKHNEIAGSQRVSRKHSQLSDVRSRVHSQDMDMTVLVVDDAETNRKMLCALLKNMNLPSEEACNGQIAVEMIKKDLHKYSLVMMDNLMPVMNGMDAARAMRAAGYPYIIAGVTGNVMDDDIRQYLDAGANIIYGKPVKLPALKLLVSHIKKEGSLSQPGKTLVEEDGVMKWVGSSTE